MPAREIPLQRRIAMVDVEIPVTEPSRDGVTKIDLHPCTGRDRSPAMVFSRVQYKDISCQRRGIDPHDALKSRREWIGNLIDPQRQCFAVPVDAALANEEFVFAPTDGAPAAFSHRPAFAFIAVERDIQRAMIERVGRPAPACKRVVGREHASDKCNERDAVLAIVAQSIDIPPRIAVFRNDAVEARSSIRLAAAICPDSDAIGTPGPGCALPPAK
jgi:hypothetical protein